MKESPQIFAFYSFKGGVGRSMAVLNLAYALAAKGRHVLVLDMDLEAPGLSGFLHREKEITGFARFDMLDLVGWARKASPPLDPLSFPPLSEYVVSIPAEKLESIPRTFSELGRLDIIPVEEERDYYDRLTRLAMGSLDQDALVRIGSVLRAWLKSLRFPIDVPDYYGPDCEREAPYDYVLIDSRTGITETGGLCIGPLSDQLVILSALNDQNVEGTRKFLEEVGVLKNSNRSEAELERKPYLLVASLVPAGEIETKRERLNQFEKALRKVHVKLSYHPQLALKETIFTRDYRDEYLAREYEELLRQVLLLADDGDNPVIAEMMSKLPRSSPEFRQALRRLTRLASTSSSAILLRHILSTADFAQISEEVDFILWDRVCRVLCIEGSHSRLEVFDNWAILLTGWGQHSTNPELATLRLEAARMRCEQILQSEQASTVQKMRALLNRGVTFHRGHELEAAITDYTAVITSPSVPPDQKAIALINRGMAHGQLSKPEKAIDDYTAVIQLADAEAKWKLQPPSYHTFTTSSDRTITYSLSLDPANVFADFTPLFQWPDPLAKLKAHSLVNRGQTFRAKQDLEQAIADYTEVIHMAGAPAEQRALALADRGSIYSAQGDTEKAIADYSSVIQTPDISIGQKVKALVNRGITYRQRSEAEAAITDFTAVIQMPDTPADQKASALVKRGVMYGLQGEAEKTIADCTAVIQMGDAPKEQIIQALLNRGVAYFKRQETERAIDDYTTVIQIPDVPAEQKAYALISRGVAHCQQRELEKAITDYATVIQMPDASPIQKAQALLSRGWAHYLDGHYGQAIDDEQQAISLNPSNSLAHANLGITLLVQGKVSEASAAYDAALYLANSGELDEITADLREAIEKHGQIPGAEEVMARLEVKRQVLSRGSTNNIDGTAHQEPDGSERVSE